MGNRYASGKNAIAICDRCGFRFRLRELKELVVKTKKVNVLACPSCWDPDQPQLQLGMYPVDDPQGLRNPRPDQSLAFSGSEYSSRGIQWGWNPVGGATSFASAFSVNDLVATGFIGTVTVTTS
jgi:hypothetical protein